MLYACSTRTIILIASVQWPWKMQVRIFNNEGITNLKTLWYHFIKTCNYISHLYSNFWAVTVTMLNNILDNIKQCGQHNIVQSCFQQPSTTRDFLPCRGRRRCPSNSFPSWAGTDMYYSGYVMSLEEASSLFSAIKQTLKGPNEWWPICWGRGQNVVNRPLNEIFFARPWLRCVALLWASPWVRLPILQG